MNGSRLILKQPKGWFAAGREFAQALVLLSDGAFRLYVYTCLTAHRYTGRLSIKHGDLAQALAKDPETVFGLLQELQDRGVCCVEAHVNSDTVLEICDRFWPYQKQRVAASLDTARAEFVQQVREMFLAPACVQASFSAADEEIAVQFYRRGIPREQVQRAILLGCARKYMAAINNQIRAPITSLQYFAGVVDEVLECAIPESYWPSLRHKVARMEQSWLETNTAAN